MQLHQTGETSSDVLLDLQLEGISTSTDFFAYQSSWKYAPESNTPPASNWRTSSFSDAGWNTGNAPFGFGNHFYNTQLIRGPGNNPPNYPVYYFRKTFTIADINAFNSIRLSTYFDDGIKIFVNDTEVARKNLHPHPDTLYTRSAGDSIRIDSLIGKTAFQNGTNIIAVQLHQTGETSSDVLFDLELKGDTTTISPPAISIKRYPYLQLPSHNRMSVWWTTNQPTNSTVRYSTNANMSGFIEQTDATVNTQHKINLTGLQPDTQYYYLVGYGTGNDFMPLQNNTSATNFRTLPAPSATSLPLRFWILGDSGAGKDSIHNPRPYAVRDAYLAYLQDNQGGAKPDAALFIGDNSNGEGIEGEQEALDRTIFKFYNRPTDQQLLSRIPFWTVMGNHDYNPDYNYVHTDGSIVNIRKSYHTQIAASFSSFAFPENGEIGGQATNNKKGYYSFDQGDIHFVVLNPYSFENDTKADRTIEPFFSFYEIFSKKSISWNKDPNIGIEDLPQVQWLRNDLTSNTKKWTIVTFHQPPFTTIGHYEDEFDLVRIRTKLLPILEEPQHRVDMVLVSHSHAYLRGGMVRKMNGVRKTDFEEFNNLGKYPVNPPYVKSNNEAAYSYLLTGSAGRGAPGDGDGKLNDPRVSELPVDSLANNNDFYHAKGGSVELLFRENRLDVTFIKESNGIDPFVIAD
ncbi:MAG: metallophosphoesterase family protein, partial [Bacteroidetes bacterium]|nr:metallophosphoesterase family protein [Bacteroidota bacterium]